MPGIGQRRDRVGVKEKEGEGNGRGVVKEGKERKEMKGRT